MSAVTERIRRDEGVALMAVLGVIAVVTVLTIASFYLASQALNDARRVDHESRAFHAASVGLETALTTFSDETMADEFPKYGTTPEGTYVLYLEDLGDGEYRLTCTGTSPDGFTETVSQQFYYMNLWQMNFAGTGDQTLISGSGGLAGTTSVTGPFYMTGNLNVANNMFVAKGPLFVKGLDASGGNVNVDSSGRLGEASKYIKVYATGSVPENYSKGNEGAAGGVFVSQVVRSVPDINLPDIGEEYLASMATKAMNESIDNIMGPASQTGPEANLECLVDVSGNRDPNTYVTMQPPNSTTWTRNRPIDIPTNVGSALNPNYKFIGEVGTEGPVIAPEGQGGHALVIGDPALKDSGNYSFGSWAGDGHYTLGTHDDFAYDDVNNILYIEGTVFVDGPVHFAEDMLYIGNGSIVANGDILVDGLLRPVGTNEQAAENGYALGLVTPGNITFTRSGVGNPLDPNGIPTVAGAFFAEGTITFTSNCLCRGSLICGKIGSQHPNMHLVTNPLLPEYLPESMPGLGSGILMPGIWSRR